jgi:drug/metabolite transporter (DMT)-like permease
MRSQPGMTGQDWALLVLLSVLWGGSFFFAKVIVREVPPFTLVLVRFAGAAGALGAYLMISRTTVPRSLAIWGAFAGMGALNNLIPVALISWAQMKIPSGLAAVLIASTPVFSILVAHSVTADERMSVNKLMGVGLGIGGVTVLIGIDTVDGSARSILAMVGCLVAALSYGFANVFGRRFKRMGIAPTVGAFGQLTATAVMVAPFAFVFDQPWRLLPPTLATWASMLGLVLLSTALAYAIFFRLLATVGATNVSLVTLLIPVSAILLGAFVLGERLSALQLAGMLLIGCGLVAMDDRAWSVLRSLSVQKTTG